MHHSITRGVRDKTVFVVRISVDGSPVLCVWDGGDSYCMYLGLVFNMTCFICYTVQLPFSLYSLLINRSRHSSKRLHYRHQHAVWQYAPPYSDYTVNYSQGDFIFTPIWVFSIKYKPGVIQVSKVVSSLTDWVLCPTALHDNDVFFQFDTWNSLQSFTLRFMWKSYFLYECLVCIGETVYTPDKAIRFQYL